MLYLRFRTSMSYVIDNSFTNVFQQWQGYEASCLLLPDAYFALIPVDVGECQMTDIARSKAKTRSQQYNGIVSFSGISTSVYRLFYLLYFLRGIV